MTTENAKAAKRRQNKDFQTLGLAYCENPTSKNLSALYKVLKKPLTAFIYGFVKDSDQADIVFSDVMMKVIKKRDSFGSKPGMFSTWIYTISRNTALTYMHNRDKWNYADTDVSEMYDVYIPDESRSYQPVETYQDVTYIDKANDVEMSATKADVAHDLMTIIFDIIDKWEDRQVSDLMRTKLTRKMSFQELADMFEVSIADARRLYNKGKRWIARDVKDNPEASVLKELFFEKMM